ncbi:MULTISPECIES: phosphoethanolamine transferase [Aliivibrio]|uniref:Phosphoethanolamine--lipid A transferase n=1 Tax=Aliivibrio finisterrensis TaxID=511998 RepID=A0A4Q5KYK2_9GAMM|nr:MULTISPECIES: phosphoethanolamine--lipid A transferase [Aliivibrio]MDD9178145.1 phosphoethanolamine--lipid A transferase [Aliivibrio sp. A6]RYU53575.1 phosphoethanolamine--lipid A transferase [Aliivibrio finisterrensis]RYU54239.1 phosphoethanolamine--lipid A transferase [Aliivibrio finisterrensis]RYU59219.1 phosphoethanolamine--lipid A transferase [Aliivibrio finisterrensis]RYU62597.1 phosphoethanolamine--lipid A transferase [Aliivibrio finisterrensis]
MLVLSNLISKLKSQKITMNMVSLLILVSLYFAVVFNYPINEKIYQLSQGNGLFLFLTPAILTCAFIIIFSMIAVPYLFKGIVIILTLTSSMAFYAALQYNTMFDYAMIENIFETNVGEASSYLSSASIGYFIVFGVLPSLFLLKVKVIRNASWGKELFHRAALVSVAIVGLLLISVFYFKDYASIGRNNSYLNKMINPADAFNTVKYINNEYLTAPLDYITIGEDAEVIPAKNGKPTLMVVLVGETARAQNSAYNGYDRETNPYTKDLGLIAFQNTSSCGTATAHSLPCMFSNMVRTNYNRDRANNQDDVLDVLTHAGVKSVWIDNDGGDKAVAKNIEKVMISDTSSDEFCNGSSCYDEVLLQGLDKRIQNTTGDQLYALHMIGSHGPTYWKRYPENMAVFTPACNRSDIENCSDEEITNVYDNTLVYTDYVIAQTIAKLKTYSDKYNVVMLYISDHGESLGENGLYLHGAPYMIAPKEQTHVPFYIWMSDDYANQKGINKASVIKKAAAGGFSHDNLFHTLLGLYGVKTSAKDNSLDIMAN